MRQVAAALEATTPPAVVGWRTWSDETPQSLDADTAAGLPALLGAAMRGVLDAHTIGGLYVTGGDVTAGVLTALDAEGLRVIAEILPLAVIGHVVGGPHDGLALVTKGGLIGDADAAVACLRALRARTDDRS